MGKSHLKWMEKKHKHIVISVVNIFGPAHLQIIGLIGFLFSLVKNSGIPPSLPLFRKISDFGPTAAERNGVERK